MNHLSAVLFRKKTSTTAFLILILVPFLFVFQACSKTGEGQVRAPIAIKIPFKLTQFDQIRSDPYHWLRLIDEQKIEQNKDEQTSRVLAYLEAENRYTDSAMSAHNQLVDTLFNEMKRRIKEEDTSVPYPQNGYSYYTRIEKEAEYQIYCRKKLDAQNLSEEVLLNVNAMAKGNNFYSVSTPSVSLDNRYISYGVDTVGRRLYTIHIKDLHTGMVLKEEIPNTTGQVTWGNDNLTLFYIAKDPQTLRGDMVKKHRLGSSDDDVTVFTEKDETFDLDLSKTKSNKYIFIISNQTLSTEYQYIDADQPNSAIMTIQPRQANLEYHVDHFADHFYIVTNADGASNFKLMKTPIATPGKEFWQEMIPERPNALLSSIEIFKDHLVIKEESEALDHFRVIAWKDLSEFEVEFPETIYQCSFEQNHVFETDKLRLNYSSLTTPETTYEFSMSERKLTVLKEEEILDYKKEDYVSLRLWANAQDGTAIPISLVYKKSLPANKPAPLLLYAYGSYGYSSQAGFNSSVISLLNRGFIYAIAHVRGGSEMGRSWYENGKLLNKMNTFSDFNDCAQYLINQGQTQADRLFAMGGSAGGLLMGVIVNTKPQLYRGVIANVPFVDVVTTMLDDSIPLTTFEYDEWGNPNQRQYYDYMIKYSPYDNVKKQNYPNLLVTTGFFDSQVQYWEPAKWVAKLRDFKTDKNLLLLKTNMEAGHGGSSGRFKRLQERAFGYAFILSLLPKETVN